MFENKAMEILYYYVTMGPHCLGFMHICSAAISKSQLKPRLDLSHIRLGDRCVGTVFSMVKK